MVMKAIYTITPDGEVAVDVQGGNGTNCKEFTRPITDALGTVVASVDKPEIIASESEGEQQQQW